MPSGTSIEEQYTDRRPFELGDLFFLPKEKIFATGKSRVCNMPADSVTDLHGRAGAVFLVPYYSLSENTSMLLSQRTHCCRN